MQTSIVDAWKYRMDMSVHGADVLCFVMFVCNKCSHFPKWIS